MPDVQGRADRRAGVVRRGLDVDVLERRALEDHAVGDAVQRHAAGQADLLQPGSLVHVVQQREVALLEHELHRGRQVGVPVLELAPRHARRAEHVDHLLRIDRPERRLAAVPGHLDAFGVVDEVVEVEADLVAFDADDVADLRGEARLAVGRQAHHLVFVAVLREAEELRERGVEQAQRMRELDAAAHVDVVAAADAPHHAAEVAEPVDGDDRGFVERRGEEGAGQMRAMVLDEVDAHAVGVGDAGVAQPARRAGPPRRCSSTREADAAPVAGAREHAGRLSSRNARADRARWRRAPDAPRSAPARGRLGRRAPEIRPSA